MKKYIRKPSKHIGPSSDLFFKPGVQKKLVSGQPGDVFEVEADKMADKVLDNSTDSSGMLQKRSAEEEVQTKPLATGITPWTLQKATVEEEPVQKAEDEEPVQKAEEEETVQKQTEELTETDKEAITEMKEEGEIPMQKQLEEEPIQQQEEEEAVQSKQEDEEVAQKKEEEEAIQKRLELTGRSKKSPELNSDSLEATLKRQKGLGSALDIETKHEMEQHFGADFSEVKIHTDSEAENLSAALGAQAFTQGHDIYFNKDKYNPKGNPGKHLLAHELTHTLQQQGVRPRKAAHTSESPKGQPGKNKHKR